MPTSGPKEGASHLRQRTKQSVGTARATAKMGRQTSECVILRCQVKISRSLCEKDSRRTSESGKIAPSISNQVMIRSRFTGFAPSMSCPRKAAFAIRAPAIDRKSTRQLQSRLHLVCRLLLEKKKKKKK